MAAAIEGAVLECDLDFVLAKASLNGASARAPTSVRLTSRQNWTETEDRL